MYIVSLGECMIEIGGQPLKRGYGGDTLNTAIYLARLLAGRPIGVHYATALGDDPLSDGLLSQWQDEGLLTDRVARLSGRMPGLYLIETDARGERRFFYWRDDSAARHYFRSGLDFSTLLDPAQTRALYLSGITLALFPPPRREALLVALADYRRAGGLIWFDNNFRPTLWPVDQARAAHEQVLTLADVALLTLDDECLLYGTHTAQQAVQRSLALGCREVVVKQGARPCVVGTEEGQWHVPPPPVARVVDTSAAGDSFAAGYLATRLRGASIPEAVAQAHRLSGVVIGWPGAIIPKEAMPAAEPMRDAG